MWLSEQFEKNHKENEYLIMLGKGEYEEELRHKTNNNIICPGFVEDVNGYMSIADIYVSASKSEGLPLSVLQAMSNGLYLLLSKIPPHAEIINENNDIGTLFSENNFSKRYRDSINKSRSVDRRNIIDIQINNYSVHTMCEGYEKLYTEVLV